MTDSTTRVAQDAPRGGAQQVLPGGCGIEPDLGQYRRQPQQHDRLQCQDRQHRRYAGLAIGGEDQRDALHHGIAEDTGQRKDRGLGGAEPQQALRGQQRHAIEQHRPADLRQRGTAAAVMRARAAGEQQRRRGEAEDKQCHALQHRLVR
jgi:hypothetical protein